MQPSHRQLLDSPEFHRLVTPPAARLARADRAAVSDVLRLHPAHRDRQGVLSRRIGEVTTLGIPLAAGVILGAWVLTAVYVIWANRVYDADVARLRQRLD